MQVITLEHVSVRFGDVVALDDITFEIQPGEYVGIIGPNGAGKSTLLKVILGIIKPNDGKYFVQDNIRIGYVPQHYLLASHFSISVAEVILMASENASLWCSKSEKKRCIAVLEMVGLDASALHSNFHSLSGGQKQRVIIARSLYQNPDILLFDEPLSGVDHKTKLQIYELLRALNQQHKTTILFVSHEVESIVQKCRRILCLNTKLQEGCHPIDFINGKLDSCNGPDLSVSMQPIHHHHSR